MKALVTIVGAFLCQFCWVRTTNFGGWDEWLVIDLTSKGLVGLPYENRPLSLFFNMPGSLLSPQGLWGFYVVHGAYLAGTGVLAWLIVRRLAPDHEMLALLTGVFATTWAPLDSLRLDTVLVANYSGVTCATFGALLLLVESVRRRSPVMAVAGSCLGAIAIRTLESSAGLLGAGPLVLLGLPGLERKSALRSIVIWVLGVGAAVLLAARPVLLGEGEAAYQTQGLGLDPHPLRVAGRVLLQFRYHLGPLFTPSWSELAALPVVVAVSVFLVLCWYSTAGEPVPGRARARWGFVGIIAAAAAYGVMALSSAIKSPARTQILAAPGIALLLASAVLAVAGFSGRWARVVTLVLSAWVVGLGTARTVAMQREWDRTSLWPEQRRTLSGVLRQAPDLMPGTFVVVLDAERSFPASFTLRHALHYLYRREVAGMAWGAHDFLYRTYFTPTGILSVPYEVIRVDWREPVRLYRYDEAVVMRPAPGGFEVAEHWPQGPLPPLPKGAVYAPRARITRGEAAPEARILDAP